MHPFKTQALFNLMAVKLRLQRHGRKAQPFYHIVAADARSKRDGKIIERIGSYNPNTNPANITLDMDKALSWLQHGAEPTNTVRTILSNQGVLYKKHLHRGVKLGVIKESEVQEKFDLWLSEKSKQVEEKKKQIKLAKESTEAKDFEREQKIRLGREEAIAARNAPEEEAQEETPEEVIASAGDETNVEEVNTAVKESQEQETEGAVTIAEEANTPEDDSDSSEDTQEPKEEKDTEPEPKETMNSGEEVENDSEEITASKEDESSEGDPTKE